MFWFSVMGRHFIHWNWKPVFKILIPNGEGTLRLEDKALVLEMCNSIDDKLVNKKIKKS